MKRFLIIFSLVLFSLQTSLRVNAQVVDFVEGFKYCDKKPLLVLITAPWADLSADAKNQFNLVKKIYGDKLNYSYLDITDESAEFYNRRFSFEPNIPYVMFFRSKGKVSRFLDRECVLQSKSCMIPRVKSFLQ